MVEEDPLRRGQPRRVGPARGVPQARAPERLRAVHEGFLDLDADGELRHLPHCGQALQHVGIAHDAAAAVHAQRVLSTGHQEDQPDVRIVEQVAHAVEALVARPVGNDEVLGVEHVHEARRVALGRDVAATPRIRRCDQHERRRGDERLAMRVQLGVLLQPRALHRHSEQLSQLADRRHHVLEHGRSFRGGHRCPSHRIIAGPAKSGDLTRSPSPP